VRPSRWPVRARLTVLYAGAFLAAGVILIAVTYVLVARSLTHSAEHREQQHAEAHAVLPQTSGDWDIAAMDAEHKAIAAFRSEALSTLLAWSVVALVGTLVTAVVAGWVLAGRALRPLRQITETANRVADRSLHERIALDGPDDEVKELADTIDAMLERLDRSFDAQRQFVANASHELRTPLAVNRTLLEVALDDPDASNDLRQLAPNLLTTSERSERLIEGLLTLARADHEVAERTPIDLADLTAAAIEQHLPEATERDITVMTDLPPAPTAGSRVLVERLVVNLVQNAVRYSPAGAEVTIRTGREGEQSILEVENPGAMLDDSEADEMFEPFRRGNGRVSDDRGIGLGLSIVRSVAYAHGGRVSAHPRDGGGLVVRVELPTRHA